MPFIAKVLDAVRRVPVVLILILSLVGFIPDRADAVPKVLIKVADTTAPNAQTNTVINVFLQNYFGPGTGDTIAGFKIYMQLDNPDIMRFQGDSGIAIDTTYWNCTAYNGPNCAESSLTIPSDDYEFFHVDTSVILIGNFQKTGTLVQDWEYVTSRSLAGTGYDILLIGLADDPFTTQWQCTTFSGPTCIESTLFIPPPIYPQASNTPLIKLLADVKYVADSLTGDERKTNIVIQTDFVNNFGLSKPNGSAIGIAYEHYLDSNYYVCNQWAGSVCVGGWTQTSAPPYDSIAIKPDSFPYVNTSEILLDNGSLTALPSPPWICGDINGSFGTIPINIIDVNRMVSWLYAGGTPPPEPATLRSNVNCLGTTVPVNILDVLYLVTYLFASGPPPCGPTGRCP